MIANLNSNEQWGKRVLFIKSPSGNLLCIAKIFCHIIECILINTKADKVKECFNLGEYNYTMWLKTKGKDNKQEAKKDKQENSQRKKKEEGKKKENEKKNKEI